MDRKDKVVKNCFLEGAISTQFISESIAKHQTKTTIGAHQIFLGQVRADVMEDENKIVAIDYSTYEEIANLIFEQIREEAFKKFNLVCMHIYHSKGVVKAGEICLFVFVSSVHRKMAQLAVDFIAEEIKSKAPIFKKEILSNHSHLKSVNE